MHMAFSMKVTPEIEELTNICLDNSKMDVSLYGQYDVKRGLRDINGVGVLAGLTQIQTLCLRISLTASKRRVTDVCTTAASTWKN